MKNKKGFTLVEATVAFVIIAIVASLVIFKFVSNHDKEYEIKFNKVVATIEANIQTYKLKYTGVTDADFAAHNDWFVDAVKTGLTLKQNNCDWTGNNSDCWSEKTTFGDGATVINADWNINQLQDNVVIAIDNNLPTIFIDLNGKNGPNEMGKDIRRFNYSYENEGNICPVYYVRVLGNCIYDITTITNLSEDQFDHIPLETKNKIIDSIIKLIVGDVQNGYKLTEETKIWVYKNFNVMSIAQSNDVEWTCAEGILSKLLYCGTNNIQVEYDKKGNGQLTSCKNCTEEEKEKIKKMLDLSNEDNMDADTYAFRIAICMWQRSNANCSKYSVDK